MKKFFLPLYIFLLLSVTIVLAFFPRYNWDMLPYMALIQKLDGIKDFDKIHTTVYNTIKEKLPEKKYQNLVDSAKPYRLKMKENTAAFESQMPYFDVKPLYIFIAFVLYKIGVSLSYATVLPSLISFFCINLISYFWGRKLKLTFTELAAALFLIAFLTWPLAVRSNPDTLGCLFLLLSSFTFLETGKLTYSTFFLLLSILARPENIVFSFLLLLIVLTGKWNKKVPLYILGIHVLLLAATYCLLVKSMNYPGWSSLFYHAFINITADPFVKQNITPAIYFMVLRENFFNLYGLGGMISLIVLTLIIFQQKITDNKVFLYKLFYIVIVLWTIIKTLLFPMVVYRFFIPPALFIVFVIIKYYQSSLSKSNAAYY